MTVVTRQAADAAAEAEAAGWSSADNNTSRNVT